MQKKRIRVEEMIKITITRHDNNKITNRKRKDEEMKKLKISKKKKKKGKRGEKKRKINKIT